MHSGRSLVVLSAKSYLSPIVSFGRVSDVMQLFRGASLSGDVTHDTRKGAEAGFILGEVHRKLISARRVDSWLRLSSARTFAES